MIESYNCLCLDNGYVFQVGVYNDNDNKKFFKIDGDKIPFEKLKVGQLAELISHKGKFGASVILNLWIIDVDKSKLNHSSTKDNINELGGKSMEFESKFTKYLHNYKSAEEENINIVAAIAGKCLPMFYLSNKKFAVIKYRFGLISFSR